MIDLLAQAAASAPSAPHTYGTKLDYAIIIIYLALILGFGSIFGRFTKSTKDFFFSGAKFSWWLIGMSMVATGVGSYSFLKYSEIAYKHGMSSGMSYTNDWFFIPFFMFGWLPIIYFSRVRSIPEYFQRRFGTLARFLAVLVILEYMIGYIGYNLFTLGVAAHQIVGVEIWQAVVVIAIICGVYVTAGGQTAVIFTDLAQGAMLLVAGFVLFVLGLDYIALDGVLLDGLKNLWSHLSLAERLPFASFNSPQEFNFVGVFWQDGIASSITFLFISQGLIMRFMAAKSVNEGRKTILFNTVFILPLAMIVVGNAGWVTKAAVSMGLMSPPSNTRDVFVILAETVCKPGVFGFVLAALCAALMSTIDTLTNATAALFVYDIYQPYIRRGASDRHYMNSARWASIVTTLIGLFIGLWFATRNDNMYKLHAMFQAFVTPPIVAAVFLGAFWKRFTSGGAVAAMVGGMVCIWLSKQYPILVRPFAHGVPPDSHGQYNYMTACFGLVCSAAIGVTVSFFTKRKTDEEIAGLWIGTMEFAKRRFKGAEPNYDRGRSFVAGLRISSDGTTPVTDAITADEYQTRYASLGAGPATTLPPPGGQPPPEYAIVRLSRSDMARLKASPGDLIYVADRRWWLGGLRSLHCRAGQPHDEGAGVLMAAEAAEAGSFKLANDVRVEKFF